MHLTRALIGRIISAAAHHKPMVNENLISIWRICIYRDGDGKNVPNYLSG